MENSEPIPLLTAINAVAFLTGTTHTVSALFDLLKREEQAGLKEFFDVIGSKPITAEKIAEGKGREYSANLIAGCVLQIAYKVIEDFGIPKGKSPGALHFESEIERLRVESNGKSRLGKKLILPDQFCVGRDIGDLPLGIIIFAARNQFNHYGEERLSVLNELAFNHLAMLYPNATGRFSFDTRKEKRPLAYAVLAGIGWLGRRDGTSGYYEAYKKDMSEITQSDFQP